MPTHDPTSGQSQSRFLFYSHDGLGLGHTRRNLAIAAALVELCPDASVLLACGTDEAHRLGLPAHVDVLKLPGLRKTKNDEYAARRLPVPKNDIRYLRSCLLEAAIRAFRPAVVLIEKHPFGARGEFRAGLQTLKEYGGRSVLGLRDILDDPAVVRREWAQHRLQERIAMFHDRVFVYGEPAVFDPVVEYRLPEPVARRTCFCGYVVNQDDDAPSDPRPPEFSRAGRARPVVLATAGGGEDGFALLEHFISAADGAPWQGIVVAGPMIPEPELGLLREKAARATVQLHSFIPKLPALFGFIDALVCMGGYNTLTEAAAQSIPTVCVPRIVPRFEQLIRARAFERLGLLRMVHPKELGAAALRDAVSAALLTHREGLRDRVRARLNFDGARCAAHELLALAASEEVLPDSLTVAAP